MNEKGCNSEIDKSAPVDTEAEMVIAVGSQVHLLGLQLVKLGSILLKPRDAAAKADNSDV